MYATTVLHPARAFGVQKGLHQNSSLSIFALDLFAQREQTCMEIAINYCQANSPSVSIHFFHTKIIYFRITQ